MIDQNYNVRRYVTEFSNETDELIAQYELSSFDLAAFQKEFSEPDPNNPMFDCYPVKKENLDFIQRYLGNEPNWDFINFSYFVEASSA